jgi:hypothetical protein
MAQSVIINGVTYASVPEVAIPKSGGGTAAFFDIDDATINGNAQLLNGVTAYGAGGVKYTGNVTLPVIAQDSTTKVLSIS